MTRDQVLTNPRHAGEVLRYHTWPMHHRQTVGEHTWQVMRIYWQIFGALSPEVSTYIIWHDVGELVTGDLPFPVKKNNPHLKAECDYIEARALEDMGIKVAAPTNSAIRVKLCDLVDMYECGQIEVKMGNAYALPIVNDVRGNIVELLKRFTPEDRALVSAYLGEGIL